ncbi:MAG: pyrroline-5-carboxylate reductase [Proteobacteria bacterium]|nr:pyrroline-5-carboxylate reductase [Pseudomonadota bacterium]
MGLKLALVGCGNMGSALLKGWLTLSNSMESFSSFWIINPHRENVAPFLKDKRVQWFSTPDELPHSPDVIIFAVKPLILDEVLPLYTTFDSFIISIASGRPLAFYETIFTSSRPILRVMPNTPVEFHKGVIGLLADMTLKPKHMNIVKMCFQELGFCLWVQSDDELDKLTAISGSGPAYIFYMMEALAKAAESLGFHEETAMALAINTFWGASNYAHETFALGQRPEEHRQRVTSPQGTTAAALKVLETGKFYNLIERAVDAAYTRAKEQADERKSL